MIYAIADVPHAEYDNYDMEKTMDTLTATLVIEGVEPETYEGQVLDAWQHLIDTAVVWNLQGSYGRTAQSLIERGVCVTPSWVKG